MSVTGQAVASISSALSLPPSRARLSPEEPGGGASAAAARCGQGAKVSTLLPTPDDELKVVSHHLNEDQGTMGFFPQITLNHLRLEEALKS